MSQFFLVLANVAIRRPPYLLIDEPELNLHPSLQLDFLTTLSSYASQGTIFSTHSIGLARAIGNRVYSVHRQAHGHSRVTPYEQTPRLAEFLGELGFSSYKELGFNSILLVEGPTEVQTIQQFLRWYGKDHQTVLMPLGGAALINGKVEAQIEEIKRITPNVAALVDSERASQGAPLEQSREDFRQACGRANVRCHVLERRALENYLTDDAIKRVKGEKYRALGPYELLRAAQPAWAKAENWRIAREMEKADLEDSDLGQFLAAP